MNCRFNVVFAGTLGEAQALEAVVTAATRVQAMAPRIQFVFVGGGIDVDNLEILAQKVGARNVRFLPRMPPRRSVR